MLNKQSNTHPGNLLVKAGVDLTGKEGFLAKLGRVSSAIAALLPTAQTDLSLFIVDEGALTTADGASLIPLEPGTNLRAKAKGTGNAGAVLVLADPATPADAGKVITIPATAGQYFSPGIAEEDFVDGQLVLFRPHPRIVRVVSPDTLTALTFSATATGTEVGALRTALKTILEAQGLMA